MRTRRRDRRGRGIRGPLAPPDVPVTRSRSERFDELVLDAVERLEGRWPDELREVELGVEEVPPDALFVDLQAAAHSADPRAAVPLGHSAPAERGRRARIVVYRRPVEARAPDPRARAALVHDVVVESLAELLGVSPDVVDPDYGSEPPEDPDRK
jgi:predicted Zn-dependent protease with MMP-like domain